MDIVCITICGVLAFILILVVPIYLLCKPRCPYCGKIRNETQIKFGFSRLYKCNHCGAFREEHGSDY